MFIAEFLSGVVIFIAVNAIHERLGEYLIIKPCAAMSLERWQANKEEADEVIRESRERIADRLAGAMGPKILASVDSHCGNAKSCRAVIFF